MTRRHRARRARHRVADLVRAVPSVATLIEMLLVLSILAVRLTVWFAVITLAALVLYIAYTVTVTEWRIRFGREANAVESAAHTPRPLIRC